MKHLEGFTITGGYAVVNNQLEGTGAGLLIVGSLANPGKLDMLVDCHFRDNIALKGGGLGGEYAIVNMKFCSFHRNLGKEKGGGVWLEHYGVTPGEDSPLLGIFSTNFTNNIAGTESPGGIGSAIAIENMAANVQIYNCRFADNYMLGTGGAGTIYIGDQGTKSNTGQGHDILVGHCTLAANQSLSGATHPGIYFSDSRAFQNAPKLILNSILYFNGGAAVAIDSNIGGPGGTPNIPLVTSSDIQMPTGAVNAWPGTGNIMVDPGFVDYSVRSLGLDGKSPCLNTGLDGLIVEDLLDLDDDGDTDEPTPFDLKKGYVRIAMPSLPIGAPLPPPISTDMGCHERQGYIPFP
ncbi:MAG: hypothetical protein GY930_22635 [bacterium]|nr:hypothetical protein [bacterium]